MDKAISRRTFKFSLLSVRIIDGEDSAVVAKVAKVKGIKEI